MIEVLVTTVLKNPYIWGMALTYFFIYVIRQGVTSWCGLPLPSYIHTGAPFLVPVLYLVAQLTSTDRVIQRPAGTRWLVCPQTWSYPLLTSLATVALEGQVAALRVWVWQVGGF